MTIRFLPLFGALLLCALSLAITSCAHPVFHATAGAKYPPREATCEFKMLATHPGPDYQEIGVLTIEGDRSFGAGSYNDPNAFADAVRHQVCAAGGDAVATEVNGGGYIARGIIFRKGETPAAPVGACDPICSPGFQCTAGRCVAQCNPACTSGQVCGDDRLCHASTM